MGPTQNEEGKNRILVVDDEPGIAELVAAALRFGNHDVSIARDGGEALRMAGCLRPDLIVLDVQLPDIDGFEVAERLRARSDLTPIVFLSARDDPEDEARGLDLGADDYMTKPFSVEELLSRTASVLLRRPLGGGD